MRISAGSPASLTLLHVGAIDCATEDGHLRLVAVEPAHTTVVHLEVILATWVRHADGIKQRVATLHVQEVHPHGDGDALARFGLECISVEQDVTAISVRRVAAFAFREADHNSAALQVAVVGVAGGVFHHSAFGCVELQVADQPL